MGVQCTLAEYLLRHVFTALAPVLIFSAKSLLKCATGRQARPPYGVLVTSRASRHGLDHQPSAIDHPSFSGTAVCDHEQAPPLRASSLGYEGAVQTRFAHRAARLIDKA
jgi:hypothetical protein